MTLDTSDHFFGAKSIPAERLPDVMDAYLWEFDVAPPTLSDVKEAMAELLQRPDARERDVRIAYRKCRHYLKVLETK